MSKSNSQKKNEPYIHAAAVIDWFRRGWINSKAEAIRMYVTARVLSSMAGGRAYFEGNESIARVLGVTPDDVSYAIRNAEHLIRVNPHGRGSGKPFMIIPGLPKVDGYESVSGVLNSTPETESDNSYEDSSYEIRAVLGSNPKNPRNRNEENSDVTRDKKFRDQKEKETIKEGRKKASIHRQSRKKQINYEDVLESFDFDQYDLTIPEDLALCWRQILIECGKAAVPPSRKAQAERDDDSAAELNHDAAVAAKVLDGMEEWGIEHEYVMKLVVIHILDGGLDRSPFLSRLSNTWQEVRPKGDGASGK